MAKRTISVYDRCQSPGCNRILHSIREGEAGKCSSCWIKEMPADTKKSLNKLIASVFNGTSEAEGNAVVDDTMAKLKRDEPPK